MSQAIISQPDNAAIDVERVRRRAASDRKASFADLETSLRILQNAIGKLTGDHLDTEMLAKIDTLSECECDLVRQLACKPAATIEDLFLKMRLWRENAPDAPPSDGDKDLATLLAYSVYEDLQRMAIKN